MLWLARLRALPWPLIGAGALMLAIAGLLVDRHFTRVALEEARADNRALRANVDVLKADADAKEEAALERAGDDRRIDDLKKDMTDAISKVAPGASPGPATVALGCERLRRAGVHPPALPLVCRSQGGAQAGPRP
jgi:hypothetical protein